MSIKKLDYFGKCEEAQVVQLSSHGKSSSREDRILFCCYALEIFERGQGSSRVIERGQCSDSNISLTLLEGAYV